MNCQPIYLLWRSSWNWPCWSTFTPQLVRANSPRPITTDDLERDRVLSQRIALFGWLDEKHLDIPEGEGSNGFLMFAQQGSSSIYHFICTKLSWIFPQNFWKSTITKLPAISWFVYWTLARSSLVCCSRLPYLEWNLHLSGLIRHLQNDEGADSFSFMW